MIWLNGKFENEETFPINDRGFLLGDGIFETIRAKDNVIIRLDAHFTRLQRNLYTIGIPLAFKQKELHSACQILLKESQIENAALRLTVTRGNQIVRGLMPPQDLTPNYCLTIRRVSESKPHLRSIISDIIRPSKNITSQIKTLNYLDHILALQKAYEQGADEALFCNEYQNLTCASVGNLFMIEDKSLITPPLKDGVLAGITRQVILDFAKTIGFKTYEKSISHTDIYSAPYAFTTNSLMGITPLISIDEYQKEITPDLKKLKQLL